MSENWYYRASGRECGPVAFDRVAELVRHRRMRPTDEVRHGVDGMWRPVGEVAEFSDLIDGNVGHFEESSQSSGWFYKIDGEIKGPCSASELLHLHDDGTLLSGDLIRQERCETWLAYGHCEMDIEKARLEDCPHESQPDQTSGPSADADADIAVAKSTQKAIPQRIRQRRRRIRSNRRYSFVNLVQRHRLALGVVLLIAISNLAVLAVPNHDADREVYELYAELWATVERMDERSASPDEWSEFGDSVRGNLEPIISRLEEEADVRHPVKQNLMWAGRDNLLPAIDRHQKKANKPAAFPATQQKKLDDLHAHFDDHLREVRQLWRRRR